MITHVFVKNDKKSEVVYKKAFEDLKSIESVKPDVYENPLYTLSRILGDKFYLMNEVNSPDDVISLRFEPNGSFEATEILENAESATPLLNFIENIASGFASVANAFPIPGDKLDSLKLKMAITTVDGVVTEEVTPNTFKSLWSFDKNGNIVGVYKQEEITKCVQVIQRNNAALQKMGATPDAKNAVATNLMNENQKYNDTILAIYKEIIENFFRILHNFTPNYENPADKVYNITFICSRDFQDKENSIKQTDVFSYHYYGLSKIKGLRNKFGLGD
jgi:hypothetical protein